MILPPANTLPCVLCGTRGSNRHEKLPRSRGGPRDEFNTVVLCGSGTTGCHGRVTENPDWARQHGLTVPGSVTRGVYKGPDLDYRAYYHDDDYLASLLRRATIDPDGCWTWNGSVNHHGYGNASSPPPVGGSKLAHRAMMIHLTGPVPPGRVVCHHCDVRNCIRPSHLYIGTPADNTADMMARGRHAAPKGLSNGKTKLSPREVAEIRAAVAGGESRKSVARRLGLHSSYVGRIVSGERRTP